MPGKDAPEEVREIPDGQVTVAGETWQLKPLAGLKSIGMMPKIISVVAELLWTADANGFPLRQMFEEGTASGQIRIETIKLLEALHFVSEALGKRFDEVRLNILPFLLQKDAGWLQENGLPGELLKASWIAIKYHVNTSFGQDVLAALKNSVAVEDAGAEKPTPSTTPVASP